MRRGEIWWANLDEPAGRRPVVLISRDHSIKVRSLVVIAHVTTRVRDLLAEVRIGPADGVPQASVINCDVLDTIPKSSLTERITMLPESRRRELDTALKFALGIR